MTIDRARRRWMRAGAATFAVGLTSSAYAIDSRSPTRAAGEARGTASTGANARHSNVGDANPKGAAGKAQPVIALRAFDRASMRTIEAGSKPYLLLLWGLDCTYCVQLMQRLAHWQDRARVVTLAVDPIAEHEDAIVDMLERGGLRGEAWAFGDDEPERLRRAVERDWMGEKPRLIVVRADGSQRSLLGMVSDEQIGKALRGA